MNYPLFFGIIAWAILALSGVILLITFGAVMLIKDVQLKQGLWVWLALFVLSLAYLIAR